MKRLTALLIACLLCLTTAYAAEWGEGLGPSQPYPGVPYRHLNESMGHVLVYPSAKFSTSVYCDTLQMYLPREDVELGEGKMTLYDDGGQVAVVDFTDTESVSVRPLDEIELKGLIWGGGVCVEMRLPVSLQFDKHYYVLMDEGCITAADGKVTNPAITSREAWVPVLTGEYGVSGMYYSTPVEVPVEEEPTEAPAEAVDEGAFEDQVKPALVKLEPGDIKLTPEVGDMVAFDLLMGGDAKTAVVFSENGSVQFDAQEFTESAVVTGVITDEPIKWGVVFLDDAGEVLRVVQVDRTAQQ